LPFSLFTTFTYKYTFLIHRLIYKKSIYNSDTEEESTQEKNKKSSKSNNKSSKKSSKKKKQKNILSYMTVRPDMDEINELLAMKIPRPDEDDGIDVAAMIKRNTDAREVFVDLENIQY
jgi:hypothetical protein